MRTAILVVLGFLFVFGGVWFFVDNKKSAVQPDGGGLTILIEDLLKSSESKREIVAPVPLPRLERPAVVSIDVEISDGNFDELSQGWKRGIVALAAGTECRGYDYDIWSAVKGDRLRYLLLKAQMLVESNCKADILGGGTDYGLLQVQQATCTKDEIGRAHV